MSASSSVHSNAFNFLSYLSGGVDSRTGQYNVALSLPELKTNGLLGPIVPFQLVFSALNVRDSGFGPGWNLQQTEYNSSNKVLSLNSGETYRVTGQAVDGQLLMAEKKLDNFRFYKEGDEYRIVYKTGITEILRSFGTSALPVRIYSAEGRTVTLTYVSYKDVYMLSDIKDGSEEILLDFVRKDSALSMRFYPYSGEGGLPLAVYDLIYNAGALETSLSLPEQDNVHWLFKYKNVRGFQCITEVYTPTGSHEWVYYDDEGHQHPDDKSQNLPRVTRHLADPGCGQPVVETVYAYDLPAPAPKTHHNFLGFDAPGLIWNNDGIDNLYQVTGYDYSTCESVMDSGNEVQRTERTFNSFHLLTKESIIRNSTLKRVSTTYHAVDGEFDMQPNNFQLPKQVETLWSLDTGGFSRLEILETDYDQYGNLTRQVDVNGVTQINTYYGTEQEDGCPADPEKFVRNLKETTIVPSGSEQSGALPLTTRYRYTQFKSLDPARADWLTVDSQTVFAVTKDKERTLQVTRYSYYNDLNSELLYGRVKNETLSYYGKSAGGTKALCLLYTDYTYSLVTGMFSRAGESVLETAVSTRNNFDLATKTLVSKASLIHGQPLLVQDDNNVTIQYSYDVLMRVVSEIVSPESTDYVAKREFLYTLYNPLTAEYPTQTSINVKGVKTQTLLDGFNRVVSEQRQNADAENVRLVEDLRGTYTADYDVFGNLITELEYDWLDDTQALELKTTFTYDDWGQQLSEERPDGVIVYESTDPIGTNDWKGKVVTSWYKAPDSPLLFNYTVTHINDFDKPIKIERFDGEGKLRYSLDESFYDGLGRLTSTLDAKGRETAYTYDAYDRIVQTTLPDGSAVVREYALHSSEDLPTRISVAGCLLGTQSFDGLGRLSSSVTGGRTKQFSYKPGELQPCSVVNARGQEIEYKYTPQLGEEPIERRFVNEDVSATYIYDSKNARLTNCSEQGQSLVRSYFSTGEIKEESVSSSGTVPLVMKYKYSLKGLLLSYQDVLGKTQTYTYKLSDVGRMSSTELGTTSSKFTYNGLGLVESIHTVDSASDASVKIMLEYDVYGRETLRTFDLNDVVQVLQQTYDVVDNLRSRVLSQEDQILRKETYSYDSRSRLELYECEGTQPPVDPLGRPICMQIFTFDDIDNIKEVSTNYADSGTNVAVYNFNSTDPTQLTSYSYEVDGVQLKDVFLDYDADGNMTIDEVGRIMEYDELNRLRSVCTPVL